MKITSSIMQLGSQREAVTTQVQHERLRMWTGNQRPAFDNNRPSVARPAERSAGAVHLSSAAQEMQPTKEVADADAEMTPEDELKMALLIRMIEVLTGKKLHLAPPGQFAKELADAQANAQSTAGDLAHLDPNGGGNGGNNQAAAPVGWGVEYDAYTRHYESESTQFTAAGVVTTADGREITLAIELNMSREFLQEQNVSIRLGDAARMKDPLVVNFGGTAAQLTATRYQFDIDANGQADQIAFVSPNSGFLALDRNQDGVINDGKELFGAMSGNGFSELANYDDDGNGWIDENDSIYNSLRIWSKDESGNDQLMSLGQRGVGAIYLGHVATPFAIKNTDNELLGQVRSSGVFLNENGSAGTMQQIDLVA
ncbi:VCBS repeat-containing protein [Rhodoferax sp. 4810]|uniref:VCBS repeat-containing protein n=1 Tax=Thiospirillum jenense TaxID=1653858 RepID=A0A839H5E1_9GAMM|nr:VCBS repeat-containing protein [Thiospirillum jenense]MBB1072963.1 VCBS repeat-containing protein [Rhodoferax jenense]MBB1124911.1 VCBS repeat-containing protein [Thiospirillum jenense]